MIRVTVNSTGVKVSKVASSKTSLASRQAGTAKPASNRDNVRASAKVAQTGRSRRIMVPVVNKTGKRLGEVPQSTTSAGAGKIARGEVVFSRRFGYYAWVKE
jgi:hypothetical protein